MARLRGGAAQLGSTPAELEHADQVQADQREQQRRGPRPRAGDCSWKPQPSWSPAARSASISAGQREERQRPRRRCRPGRRRRAAGDRAPWPREADHLERQHREHAGHQVQQQAAEEGQGERRPRAGRRPPPARPDGRGAARCRRAAASRSPRSAARTRRCRPRRPPPPRASSPGCRCAAPTRARADAAARPPSAGRGRRHGRSRPHRRRRSGPPCRAGRPAGRRPRGRAPARRRSRANRAFGQRSRLHRAGPLELLRMGHGARRGRQAQAEIARLRQALTLQTSQSARSLTSSEVRRSPAPRRPAPAAAPCLRSRS